LKRRDCRKIEGEICLSKNKKLLEEEEGDGEINVCLQKSLAKLIKSVLSQPVSLNFKTNRIYLNQKQKISKKLEGVIFIFVLV
jgi:hypothetical protein